MRAVAVGRTVPVLDGRHKLRVQAVWLADEYFEVAYTVSPPWPAGADAMVLPRIEAIDERGGTYDDGGGAYGRSDDGTRTEGTIRGRPGFPVDVREVTLRFVLLQRGRESEHEVTVALS